MKWKQLFTAGVIILFTGTIYAQTSGTIVSWGDNSSNQVTDTPDYGGFVQVAGGGNHSLALFVDPAPQFTCEGFGPPMNVFPVRFKRNHAIPLRAEIFDGDVELTDADLTFPPVVQVWLYPGEPDVPEDYSDDVLPVGFATEGNQFYYTEGGLWEFILDTRAFTAPGRYEISMGSGDESEYGFDEICVTEFVVAE